MCVEMALKRVVRVYEKVTGYASTYRLEETEDHANHSELPSLKETQGSYVKFVVTSPLQLPEQTQCFLNSEAQVPACRRPTS